MHCYVFGTEVSQMSVHSDYIKAGVCWRKLCQITPSWKGIPSRMASR